MIDSLYVRALAVAPDGNGGTVQQMRDRLETDGPTGLRARKRETTRLRIEQTAIALFETEGFENTTVDDIAAKADVARMSVFRYFGSKDDIIFGPEAEVLDALRSLVAEQPPLPLAEVMLRFAAHVETVVPDARRRLAVIVRSPKLRARLADMQAHWEAAVAEELAARRSDPVGPTLEDRVLATAAMVAYFVPLVEWPATAPATCLIDLVQRAVDVVRPVLQQRPDGETSGLT